MIHVLREPAKKNQLNEMLTTLESYIKLAVDINRGVIAGGGLLHADCEAALLEDGSQQEDIWGADWIPATQEIRYEAFINIRPKQHNRSVTIQDARVRTRVGEIVNTILGGV